MFDRPRAALLHALSLEPPLERLEIHAFLHRLCTAHAAAIRNCWREPLWDKQISTYERQLSNLIEQRDWSQQIQGRLRWIREEDRDRFLIFCATVLRILDAYHQGRRAKVAREILPLPAALGGHRTAFLAPPASPLTDLIPEARRLSRGPGDLKNDLQEILQLWWRLVPLERYPVQPLYGDLEAPVSKLIQRRLARKGDLRFGLASPFADLSYVIRSDHARCGADGVPYRFAELAPESLEAARESLESILTDCATHEVDVLCFPELTLDTGLQSHLSRLLNTLNENLFPAMVVTGSFHVDSDGHWVNRCRILDGMGRLLHSQDKCVFYRVPAVQAAADPALCGLLGIDHRGGYEDIRLSTSLHILDSPLGRLASPICLDYCGTELRDLLVDSMVNLLLVSAMSPRMSPFVERARDLGTQIRAATFVANSAWLLTRTGKLSAEELTLAYLPAHRLFPPERKVADPLYVFSICELLGLK